MQQVSRKLLLAGVLAFGSLTAACGDKVEIVGPALPVDGVQSVTVSPANATLTAGGTITLGVSVVTTGNAAKTVTWTSSNAAIASVDGTGKVTAPAGSPGGTVTILATATADVSKSGAAAIVVTAATVPIVVLPSIAINSVTDVFGNPVNLSNTNGQVNVSVNTSGGGLIEVFVSTSCTTTAPTASDVAVASQTATSAQAGQVVLSFNTAQLNTAGTAPRFPNGSYCIKARLTNGTAVVSATNTTPITLNNTNQFRSTIQFTSAPQAGPATSAVSSLNGLNYNQGTLTLTLTPVIFTSPLRDSLISGYLTRNGEVSGVACGAPPCIISFTNQVVSPTTGVASIAFTDTGSVAGVRSIFGYNSLPAGDTLYITSASDGAGNPITVAPTPGSTAFVLAGGIRIDNDVPTLAGAYAVTAANGYIGAAYAFSSGTTGAAATDVKAGINGVGGLTTTYFVGPVGSAAFATANSCTVTGLTAAAVGTDLANTNNTDANRAKVVVKDALGNQSCIDVASTFGPLFFFGVDKVAPTVAFSTSNNGASDPPTGYNVSKNFSFIYNDSISGFNAATPLRGTLVRNFYATPSAADCVIGTFSATALTCSTTNITVTSNFGTPPAAGGSIEFTNGTAVVGYYTITATARDRALNSSTPSLTRLAAFDNVAPTVGAVTQSPAAAVSLGTVTVSASAADAFDLASSSGRLVYNPAGTAPTPVTFQSVAGSSFGPNFDATFVTSGTASVTLSNVYRGLQGVDGTNVIQANRANPTATITVTDVGTNTATSAAGTIATSTAGANIQAGNTFSVTPTSAAPATRQTTTNLTASVGGLVADPAFQSQPFAQIDFYRVSGGELVLVGSVTGVLVTDIGANRTYTYAATSVPLAAATVLTVNTFYAVGRNAAGDAVISNAITVTNP